uniref:heme exporter protein CcmD n=1 Tax=Thaumasiovibrio occultus TaxID=1891184 RepID=UPI000B35081A|nr:heme exporter protein CcmD [Thaumasiovibrio occultus]
MYFESLSEFLAMGGYAPYVWSGVGMTLLSLAVLFGASVMQFRQVKLDIKRKLQRAERIRAAQQEDTL